MEWSTQQQDNVQFSQVYTEFSSTDHMLGHKTSLIKFKRTKIIQSIFSNCKRIILEMNKKIWEIHNCVEIKHTLK